MASKVTVPLRTKTFWYTKPGSQTNNFSGSCQLYHPVISAVPLVAHIILLAASFITIFRSVWTQATDKDWAEKGTWSIWKNGGQSNRLYCKGKATWLNIHPLEVALILLSYMHCNYLLPFFVLTLFFSEWCLLINVNFKMLSISWTERKQSFLTLLVRV